ncbi:MAG: 2-hydroxy-3-oxopropionate reductase [Burkholderiales bacterium]|nr:NAD(P)-dependent oxidoreductase [Burkholderiaceae bacterium]
MTGLSQTIAFIGLGVMGEPMCRNLALKGGRAVRGFDRDPAPLQRLAAHGVAAAQSVRAAADGASFVFLSLPSGEVVRQVAEGPDGLESVIRPGQVVVDLSTSPVDLTRDLAAQFAARGATLVDAPVARTRAAAEAGTLAIMVGAEPETFARVEPLLATFATDITLCGPVGCGQVVKILNNMIVFETVVALAEAKAIGERSGVAAGLLFDTLSKGSADSFTLRNHGMKAMLPEEYPERAFSVVYARKDLAYALRLAEQTGVPARGAANVEEWFAAAIEQGLGEKYHPVISRLIGG